MRRRPLTCLIVLVVLLASSTVTADTLGIGVRHIQTPAPRKLCKLDEPPTCIVLQPGRFLDETAWGELDMEVRRLQDLETRLTAENAFMRKTVHGWVPGWKVVAGTFVSGFIAGVVAYHYVK